MPISPHLAEYITPLCAATERLLCEETRLRPEDQLHISIREHAGQEKYFLMTCEGDASAFAKFQWWQRIPGSAIAPQNQLGCVAPMTDVTVLITVAVWGKERIHFVDELAKLAFWTRFAVFLKQTRVAQIQAAWKATGEVPENAPKGSSDPELTLKPYQRIAALCLLQSDGYSLFMEQGTGKTPTAIAVMDEDSEKVPHALNLVVCPKNVRSNWKAEIKTFSMKSVNVVILRGGKLRRMKELLIAFEYRKDYDYTVVVASYQGIRGILTTLGAFVWSRCFADESDSFKNPTTKTWGGMKKLRKSCQKRSGMTGTPICNSALDLYTEFEWLEEFHSGFASFEAFKHFYGVWKPTGNGYEKLLKLINLPLMQERLTRSAFLVRKADVLKDLPPVTHEVIEAEMTEYQKEIYVAVATQLKSEIERELDDDSTVTVTNILTRMLRLAQITAGYIPLDGEIDLDTGEVISQEVDHFDPNPKLEELVALIKDRGPTSKVIVWSCFVPCIKIIRARLELEGIKCVTFFGDTSDANREIAIDSFNNDPTVAVWVGNPAAGGVGVNLLGRCNDANGNRTMQADLVIHYASNWSARLRSQADARNHRIGTEWQIRNIDLCVVDSIDFDIRDRVLTKLTHAMQIQDIREILKRLL